MRITSIKMAQEYFNGIECICIVGRAKDSYGVARKNSGRTVASNLTRKELIALANQSRDEYLAWLANGPIVISQIETGAR